MDNELPQQENHNGKYQVQVLKFEILFCSMNPICYLNGILKLFDSKVDVLQIENGRSSLKWMKK